ncbi:protein kinase [Sorangium sp. So ce367]|uniref:serine/threonine-protein kinase n=1 Tax=Sorangium sp. So ce367 TaxID=3133305 RepID=UPI003F5F6D72
MENAGAARPSEDAGDRLGPYRLLRRLGAGGMGVVYEAVDAARGRRFALKTLRRLDPKTLYRFKNEFRRAADLSHPNLIQLYELTAEKDRWFFTMELIDGSDFRTYFEQIRASRSADGAPLWKSDGIHAILRQLAGGIAALHASGLLHLDLKPENVLIERGGRVVILDFGLSLPSSPSPDAAPGEGRELAATPLYLSPEQVGGREPSRASDWYAVGLMLFEALTGELPFPGSMWESLLARTQLPAPLPSSRGPDVPADLDELCVRLLATAPGDRPSGAEVLERLGVAPPREALRQPLIGRKQELEVVQEIYRRSGANAPAYVHLKGPSGIGKSALARRFLESLRDLDQPLVFSGRCYEWESVPYKGFDPIVDALAKYIAGLPEIVERALLGGDVHLAARIFPVLRTCPSVRQLPAAPADARDPLELRRRAFIGLKQIFVRLCARQRVVLFLDDLQWADPDGAALLVELLSPSDPAPLFVLAAYRSDDAAQSPFFREIQALRDAQIPVIEPTVVELAPLPPDEAVELAGQVRGGELSAEEGQRIARESGGNPLFVEELAREAATAPAPGDARRLSLERVVQARVAQLPDNARKVLRAVAVAARPLTQEAVVAAARIPGEDPLSALAHLRAARLVRTRGPKGTDLVEPYHDRIRESVVAELPSDELRALHGALAQAILATPDAEPELLAHHFHGAGDMARAAEYTVLAAEQADAALAFDRAAELYGQAIAWGPLEPQQLRVLRVRRGRALINAGRCVEAAPVLLDAARGAPRDERRDLVRQAVEAYLVAGHVDQSLAAARPLLEELGVTYPASAGRATLVILDKLLRLQLRGIAFAPRAEASIAAEALARIDLCWALGKGLIPILPTHGLAFSLHTLLLALDAGEPTRVGRSLAQVGGTMRFMGAWLSRRGGAYLARASELARQSGSPYLEGVILIWGALEHMYVGRWRALEQAERGARILRDRCSGVHWECAVGDGLVHVGLDARGEIEELERRATEAQLEASERGDLYGQVRFAQDAAYCRIARGDTDGARRLARWVLERWTQEGYTVQHFYSTRVETYCDLYEGRPDAARARLERDWPRIRRAHALRVPMSRIDAWTMKARVQLSLARTSGEALRSCEAIARTLDEEPIRKDGKAHAALIRAASASFKGDRRRARELLGSAIEQYTALAMDLSAACAKRLLGQLTSRADQVREAEDWMRARGVADPERWTRVFAPFDARLLEV